MSALAFAMRIRHGQQQAMTFTRLRRAHAASFIFRAPYYFHYHASTVQQRRLYGKMTTERGAAVAIIGLKVKGYRLDRYLYSFLSAALHHDMRHAYSAFTFFLATGIWLALLACRAVLTTVRTAAFISKRALKRNIDEP